MNSDWVQELVCEWISKTEDRETLEIWLDAAAERLRRVTPNLTVQQRLAHDVIFSKGPRRWEMVDVSREETKGKGKGVLSGFVGASVLPPLSITIRQRVTLVFERNKPDGYTA